MAKFAQKSIVSDKILNHLRRMAENDGKIGSIPRGIQFNHNNRCNFKCKHCFTNSPANRNVDSALSIADYARVADESDALGIFEVDIQGGEPLLHPNLLDIIKAIDPARFNLFITTNGFFLDKEKAVLLAEAGITKITVSLDGFDAKSNDEFRGVPGAYARALDALKNVRDAGMQPVINFTAGSYNTRSPDMEEMCRFAQQNHYRLAINCATPSGSWQGNFDVMPTPADTKHLVSLRKKYPNVMVRDLWNVFDPRQQGICGCPAVNILYVNPVGDVLPCPYIHIKIGNLLRQSVKEILESGFRVRYFRDYNDRCLAGENQDFVRRYLNREGMSVMNPHDATDVFAASDFRGREMESGQA